MVRCYLQQVGLHKRSIALQQGPPELARILHEGGRGMIDSEQYNKQLQENKWVFFCYRLSVWFYEQYFFWKKISPLKSKSFMQYAG